MEAIGSADNPMTPRVDPIFFNREPEHLRDFSEMVSRPSY
jgi:hypothetical protein